MPVAVVTSATVAVVMPRVDAAGAVTIAVEVGITEVGAVATAGGVSITVE